MAPRRRISNQGWIEVICGPMFAGKSEELLRRLNRMSFANLKCLAFKPKLDSRCTGEIRSRDGRKTKAVEIEDCYQIYRVVEKERPDVIAIDEVQFFDDNIIEIVQTLADLGINVLVAGLDRDFRGEPFGPIPALLTIAERITKLTAICTVCGADASRSQRLIDNKPAPYDSPTILIGSVESYAARCRHDHHVPKRPLRTQTRAFKERLRDRELAEALLPAAPTKTTK